MLCGRGGVRARPSVRERIVHLVILVDVADKSLEASLVSTGAKLCGRELRRPARGWSYHLSNRCFSDIACELR